MNTNKILRALKKQLTPLIALTMTLIGAASIAAALQLFLLGLPAAGVSALLAGAGLVLLTWKIQVTSVTSKELQRQFKVASLPRTAAAPVAAAVVPAAAPPVAVAAVQPAAQPDIAEKLRRIGTYSPPLGGPTGSGRSAAGVAPDPDSAFKLFAATHGMGAPAASVSSPRAIALVGSDELAAVLEGYGSVYRLHPSLSAAEMEHARPVTLVVEEDALNSGPWTGALEPQGARLLLELRVAMAWMRRNTGAIYVVSATGRTGATAAAMRSDTIIIDDDFHAQLKPGGPQSLAAVLATHRAGEDTA